MDGLGECRIETTEKCMYRVIYYVDNRCGSDIVVGRESFEVVFFAE